MSYWWNQKWKFHSAFTVLPQSFPDLRGGRVAQQNINLKSKLSSVTDPCELTLPVPGLQVILQPFPHTKLLGKALVSAGKKPHTHTHKRFAAPSSSLWLSKVPLPTVNTPKRPGSTPGMGTCQHSSAWLAVQPGTHGSLALTHSATHLEILSRTREN